MLKKFVTFKDNKGPYRVQVPYLENNHDYLLESNTNFKAKFVTMEEFIFKVNLYNDIRNPFIQKKS